MATMPPGNLIGGNLVTPDQPSILTVTEIAPNLISTGTDDALYAPETLAYFTGLTGLNNSFKLAVSQFIAGLRASGLWGKIDSMWLLAGPNKTAAYKDMRGNGLTLTEFGTITHTPNFGVRGDGTSGYLSTGYIPGSVTAGNWELNGASAGGFVNDPTVRTDNYVLGVISGTNPTVRLKARQVTSETIAGYINDAAGGDVGTGGTYGRVPALFSLNRTGASTKQLWVNRRQQGAFTTASTAVPDQAVTLLRSGSSYSTEQLSFAYLGYGLRAAEIRQLSDAVGVLLQAIMRTIFPWGDSLTFSQIAGGGQSANPWPAKIQADLGRLVYNGGIQGETSTQISARMRSDDFGRLGVSVIWAGRNNYSAPATVKADIAAMVAWLGHSRFIILSVLNGNYNPSLGDGTNEWQGGAEYATIVQLNSDLAALYPNNYIDIRSILVAAYNPGIPQDVIDHGHDIPPSSLRNDKIHLVDAGYDIVKTQVENFIAENGW